MNLKSVYSKLFMGFLITLILSFSVTGYYIVKRSSSNTQSVALEELKGRNEHIADLVETVDEQDIRRILDDYAKTSKSAFHIEGGTLHDSFGKVQIGLVLDDASMKSMKVKEGAVKIRNHDNFYQYSKSYKIHNQIYIITVQKDVSKSASAFLDSFILSGVIMFLVGTVVFLVVSDIIVRPISKLTAATKELSKGNYKVRVGYAGDDEIGKLYVAFNKMAVELNKQEARRQQFISDVSHEFQTPLTAISGFAGILKMEDLPAEQRMKYADIIAFNAKRLSTLSKNMLQLTLLEGEDVQLEKSKYSLIDQLNRVIETEDNNALAKDIEIEFKHPRGDIEIVGDEARMEQVWINLIGNAIKYTNEHGVVTVDIRKTTKDIEVRVEDTGVGMSEEAISHIFERFYREDKSRSVEGNGLGLSIVKRILDLHEFSLDVTSQEDVGSVFTVKIPYAPFGDFAKRLNIKEIKNMKILEKKIKEEGQVLEPDILKVDSFLNHQIDVSLFQEIGQTFQKHFSDKKINKILTIEASGIGLAVICAQYFDNCKVVFVKKAASKITDDHAYTTTIHSFTKNTDYIARVSADYLNEDDHVLILDDFLANGEAILGMYDLCQQAHATVEGIGVVIAKGFQSGITRIKQETGLDVYALEVIEGFEKGKGYIKEVDICI